MKKQIGDMLQKGDSSVNVCMYMIWNPHAHGVTDTGMLRLVYRYTYFNTFLDNIMKA